MSVCLLPPGGRRRRSSRCEPLPQRRLELRGLHGARRKARRQSVQPLPPLQLPPPPAPVRSGIPAGGQRRILRFIAGAGAQQRQDHRDLSRLPDARTGRTRPDGGGTKEGTQATVWQHRLAKNRQKSWVFAASSLPKRGVRKPSLYPTELRGNDRPATAAVEAGQLGAIADPFTSLGP